MLPILESRLHDAVSSRCASSMTKMCGSVGSSTAWTNSTRKSMVRDIRYCPGGKTEIAVCSSFSFDGIATGRMAFSSGSPRRRL